ncbi:hypothetical protein NM688_g7453 [Phlebia brevispora]|uniref:Uncharacterized protein n=1 Tax=Phlebia brevispora TaxID=194682 RepID=A0ACC1S526_9APHY|nr:hypothetical protein NM688_g7453 [Phlebia brevispora]
MNTTTPQLLGPRSYPREAIEPIDVDVQNVLMRFVNVDDKVHDRKKSDTLPIFDSGRAPIGLAVKPFAREAF